MRLREEGEGADARARAVSGGVGSACGPSGVWLLGGPTGLRGRLSARCGGGGDARASAERVEWLTGWSALSVGDARGRRGLSGDGFAEPEGKEGRAGVGLLGWAAGEGAGPAQGKGEGAGPASGRAGPRELGCWRLGFGPGFKLGWVF